jgi:murein DD-endopeptidase MepM/ murein hydrolase activator NlpD
MKNFFIRGAKKVNYFIAISVSPPCRYTAKSHPFSRLLRGIFEHRTVKPLLGIGLTIFTLIITAGYHSTTLLAETSPVLEIILSPPPELTTQTAFRYPLTNQPKINQGFHSWHPGIDLKGNLGDPVFPVSSGMVNAVIRQQSAYGNHVIIDHGNGLISLYAHLQNVNVQLNQYVSQQQFIGWVGNTGQSTGAHLHLEIIYQNQYLNPATLLNL